MNVKISIVKGFNPNIQSVTSLYNLLKIMATEDVLLKEGETLRDLYANDKAGYDKMKANLGGFILGEFSYRDDKSLVAYSPLLGFDIDHITSQEDYDRVFSTLAKWNYSFLVMPSVSGAGIRLLVKTKSTLETHKSYYSNICDLVSQVINIKTKSQIRYNLQQAGLPNPQINSILKTTGHIDDVTGNISRFWYYSGVKKEEVFFNKKSDVFHLEEKPEVIEVKETATFKKGGYVYEFTEADKTEYLIEQIERSRTDVTSGVSNWFKVGCGIAKEFGHAGRAYFQRICAFHPDYNAKETDKEYTRCMSKSAKNTVSIASFYELCKTNHIELDYQALVEKHSNQFQNRNSEVQKKIEKATKQFKATDLERSIVGACIKDPMAYERILDTVPKFSNNCFVDEWYREVFKAIEQIHGEGTEMNVVAIHERLAGTVTMSELEDLKLVGYTEYLETNVNIVFQHFAKRNLIALAHEVIAETPSIKGIKWSEHLEKITNQLSAIADIGTHASEKHINELVSEAVGQIKVVMQKRKEGAGLVTGVPTGLNAMDEFTSGYQPTDFIVRAARPGMGKTASVICTALEAAKKDIPVGIFSLEMGSVQLAKRMISTQGEVDSKRFLDGDINDHLEKKINEATQIVGNLPIIIDDKPAISPIYFLRVARKWKRLYGIGLLIVDYLQLMSGEKGQSDTARVEAASRMMKQVAKELNIPVIALSQLNRSVETRGGTKRPQLSDLRQAGAIEEDADMVELLYRGEYYGIMEDAEGMSQKGVIEINVAKGRHTGTGLIKARFMAYCTKITDALTYEPNIVEVSPPNPFETVRKERRQMTIQEEAEEDLPF